MPITVHAYHASFTPAQQQQVIALYDTSPEFGDGNDALTQLTTALNRGDVFYAAEFNGKMIGGIWSRGQGDARKLQYIVVHPSNRGRGVAETLVKGVCDSEYQKGVLHFHPGCGAIHRMLNGMNRLSSTYIPAIVVA